MNLKLKIIKINFKIFISYFKINNLILKCLLDRKIINI